MRSKPKWLFPVLALLPVLGLYACLRVYPIAETLRLSLFKWNIISRRKPFVELDNFVELMSDPLFLEAIFNTTVVAFGVLVITIPVGLALAALINSRQGLRRSGFYETSIFLPHVVSLVPAAMAWKWIFDARLGPLNALIGWFGIPAQSWLFDPTLSLVCLIVLCSWQSIGYAVLIFLVGLKNVPGGALRGRAPRRCLVVSGIPVRCRSRC